MPKEKSGVRGLFYGPLSTQCLNHFWVSGEQFELEGRLLICKKKCEGKVGGHGSSREQFMETGQLPPQTSSAPCGLTCTVIQATAWGSWGLTLISHHCGQFSLHPNAHSQAKLISNNKSHTGNNSSTLTRSAQDLRKKLCIYTQGHERRPDGHMFLLCSLCV